MTTSHAPLRDRVRLHGGRRARGFTLVELMVAMAIGLVVMAGLVAVISNTSASRNELERTGRQVENGRYAVDLISDDLRLAGFYGEYEASGTIASLPDPCSTTDSYITAALPLAIQGYSAPSSNPLTSCASPTLQSGTDVLVIRRTDTRTTAAASPTGNEKYLQASLCGTDASPVTVGTGGTTTFGLQLKDCATVAPLRKFQTHIYFISPFSQTSGDGIPTLKRLELGPTGFTTSALVEGIESFRIEYGVDTDGDGVPNAWNYDAANATSPASPNNWTNVVAVRLYVTARNLEGTPGYAEPSNKTYQTGFNYSNFTPITTAAPSGTGQYRRHSYTAMVRLVNPASRRETP